MKKIIAVFLAVVMCLSFVACDGGDKNLYAIGDMVSTDCAQLTLESFEIVNEYGSLVNVDGKIFAVLTFSVKNIGKNELGYIKTINENTHSLLFSSMPCIDYNDGYLFSYDDKLGNLDFCSTHLTLSDLTPLSDGITVEVVILVPPEVKANEDNPLLVKMAVPKTNGTKVFTYKIR
ncbi:MAG: hypothetical protein E7516_02170 [Ruminococcaceae bacterium]|nr:hypothetical protein [Oscillospiraceae bacterium]